MVFLKFFIKIFIMLASVALMAVPAGIEFINFRIDKKRKISYKRLRTVIFTLVYIMVATVLMCFAGRFIGWLKTLPLTEWLITKFSISGRTAYTAEVYVTIAVNFVIGLVFVILNRIVNVGIEEKNLTVPQGDSGEFSILQKIERAIIRFFNTETWFFVGTILKYLCIALSCVYGLAFFMYQLPALFGADWIPYKAISSFFGSGYIYPVITLLGILEFYFFLEGLKLLENECPGILENGEQTGEKTELCLEAIDEEVKKQFKDFYVCDVELSKSLSEELAVSAHDNVTNYIGKAVENDGRDPQKNKEIYLNCVDKLVKSDKSILINGSFFSEFSAYFFRYISIILARGDNVAFVCNSDLQTDDVYNFIQEGMAGLSSLYCGEANQMDFDNPIWKIVKIREEHDVHDENDVDEASVLVTSLSYLCSAEFEREHSNFIHLLDTVVFVNSAETVNTFNRQMSILNTKLKHITKNNAALSKNSRLNPKFKFKYMAKDVRYICFDDTRIPGLDKVLKNMLAVDFDSQDVTCYGTSAVVRCYNYEAAENEVGKRICPQFVDTGEKVDAIMSMAVLCLANGADSVDVFAEGAVPYNDIDETIRSNLGQVLINADGNNIRLNKHRVNSHGYHVVLAMDSGNNLPAALRKYVSMASCSPALIVVFSKPYMLRDYYSANISSLWHNYQVERIPVEEGTKKDVAQKILLKANAGGISEEEIIRLASGVSEFDKYVKSNDVNSILRMVLKICGVAREDRIDLYRFFEYSSSRDFDESGAYVKEDKILLRHSGKLFDLINGRDMVTMVYNDSETALPVPKKRLTQHFITGQNLLHEGKVYNIQKIDTRLGKVHARLAHVGKNEEVYQYIQRREYRMEASTEQTEFIFPTKHMILNSKSEDIEVNDIFVTGFRAPLEVLTKGYFEIDSYTHEINTGDCKYYSISDEGNDFLAKQTYRRYGMLKEPVYSTESILKDTHLTANENGALVMAVRLKGNFGADKNKMLLLSAVMLNELLHAMFPSVEKEIAVCPVIDGEISYADSDTALLKQPRLVLKDSEGLLPKEDFTLLIIEDSNTDLGVVSSLMSSGDDVVKTLFTPLYEYLKWYLASEKRSEYLYNGLDHEPDCFDFKGLCKLAQLLGDGKHVLKFADIAMPVEYSECDFCGERYINSENISELEDGRKMCKKCAANIVPNNRRVMKEHLDRAVIFLESTYGIDTSTDYEICFETTIKIINELKQNKNIARGNSDIPLKSFVDKNKKISVENTVPSVSLTELLVRELTYAWQMKNLPELDELMAQGLIALVAVQYLNFLNDQKLVSARTTYYESTANISGEGYRKLAGELLDNPKFKNNPFTYLLEVCGKNYNDFVEKLPEPSVGNGEFGKPYVPTSYDRVLDGSLEYFYYSRLNDTMKKAYDAIYECAKNHQESVQVENCTVEDLKKVMDAIWYDRPELFWLESASVSGDTVFPQYAATAEEVAELQKRIDLAVPKFIEGIDDSMCAYEVAIRIHDKVMRYVDYDTVTLNREKQNGEKTKGKIDYIRTICGVFLDGKAVCDGYARAVEYLLQKLGVECGEVGGTVKTGNGMPVENHGWNIIKIDGDYYYLDVTWDDRSNTIQKVKRTDTGFDYFCVTTEEILRTRNMDLNPLDMPLCTATRANYYYHNDLVTDSYDLTKIKEFAKNAAQNKEKFFTFKCKSKQVFDMAVKELFSMGKDCYEILKVAAKVDKTICSSNYSYIYDENIRTITVFFKYQ